MARFQVRESLPDQDLIDIFLIRLARRLEFLTRPETSAAEREEAEQLRHTRFVVWVAYRQRSNARRTGFTIMDLIQEGYAGLLDAFATYDPTQGAFSTHLGWRVRAPMTRAMDRSFMQRGLRLPSSKTEELRNLKKTVDALIAKHARLPTDSEIVKELVRQDVALDDAWRLVHLFSVRAKSLSEPLRDSDNEDIVSEEVADCGPSPEGDVASCAMMQKLISMINRLPSVERDILTHTYQLFGAPNLTLRELANRHSCAESSIRNYKRRAIQKIRDQLRKEGLDLLTLLPRDGASTAR